MFGNTSTIGPPIGWFELFKVFCTFVWIFRLFLLFLGRKSLVFWWCLQWICKTLEMSCNTVFSYRSPPFHEHRKPFCHLVSSSVSFFSVSWLSLWRSFAAVVGLLPWYFILFENVINVTVFTLDGRYWTEKSSWALGVGFVPCYFVEFAYQLDTPLVGLVLMLEREARASWMEASTLPSSHASGHMLSLEFSKYRIIFANKDNLAFPSPANILALLLALLSWLKL